MAEEGETMATLSLGFNADGCRNVILTPQIHSGSSTVFSEIASPVLTTAFGSKSRTCASSLAYGKCSTPLGTVTTPSRKREGF